MNNLPTRDLFVVCTGNNSVVHISTTLQKTGRSVKLLAMFVNEDDALEFMCTYQDQSVDPFHVVRMPEKLTGVQP